MIKLSELIAYEVMATDGPFGRLDDVLFDGGDWTVRYFLIDIGSWSGGNKVVISPQMLERIERDLKGAQIKLSREAVGNSLSASELKVVSRREDDELGWLYGDMVRWWSDSYNGGWGLVGPSATIANKRGKQTTVSGEEPKEHQGNLRSFKEIKRYHLVSDGEEFGNIEDFLADPNTWTIQFLEIDTKNLIPSKHVLLPLSHVTEINWPHHVIRIDLAKQLVIDAPDYDGVTQITDTYAKRLEAHYERGSVARSSASS